MIGSLGQNSRLLFLAVLCVAVSPRQSASATVEETLAALNAKPAEERQKILVENARKEGSVTFYAATNMRDTQEIVAGFNKFYPFVKVGITSLGGPGVLNKVTTEERAGVALADVVTMTGGYVPELIEKKMLAKYRSPMVPFVRKGFVDAEGYWPGVYAIGYTIIYNNKRVLQKDAPKRYEDLLQPRWKNNLLMDAEAHDLLAGLIDLWGEAKATTFLRQIAQDQKVHSLAAIAHIYDPVGGHGRARRDRRRLRSQRRGAERKGRAHRLRRHEPDYCTAAVDHRYPRARAPSLCFRFISGLPFIQRGERNHGEKPGPLGAAQRCAVDCGTAGRSARCSSVAVGAEHEKAGGAV